MIPKMKQEVVAIFISISLLQYSCSNIEEVHDRGNVFNSEEVLIKETLEVVSSERRDLNYEYEFISIDDSVSIYTIQKGKGIPIVLLNGGPGNSCHSFIPYFDRASEFSKVIYYDPRGVGKSDWIPGEGYSTDQLVEDLEKIRKKLGLTKWVVAGWSFGGLAAQHYVTRYPEKVLGLVLISSAYSAEFDFADSTYLDFTTENERRRVREIYSISGNRVVPTHSDVVDLKTMSSMVYNGYINGDWKRQFFYKPSIDEISAVASYEWVHDKDYNRLIREDGYPENFHEKLKNVIVPVLIYYGKYDMSFSSQLPERVDRMFINSKLVIVDSASHNSFKEQPEKFFTELQNFISELPKQAVSLNKMP